MKKLKLDLDDLRVQTFDPQSRPGSQPKGTLFGFENPIDDLLTVNGPTCSCQCPPGTGETGGEWTCTLSCDRC